MKDIVLTDSSGNEWRLIPTSVFYCQKLVGSAPELVLQFPYIEQRYGPVVSITKGEQSFSVPAFRKMVTDYLDSSVQSK